MSKTRKEFLYYYENLAMEPNALCIALGLHRSTLGKWLDNSVQNVPAVGLAAIKMLWFMKSLNPDLLCHWLLIQDYGITGDDALDSDNISILKDISKQPHPSVMKMIKRLTNEC